MISACIIWYRRLLDYGEGLRYIDGALGYMRHYTRLDCDVDQTETTKLVLYLCTFHHNYTIPGTSVFILEERFVWRVDVSI
jgi:hypothetical protein